MAGALAHSTSCLGTSETSSGVEMHLPNRVNLVCIERPMTQRNALTFDVEEHFHVHAFDGIVPRDSWNDIPSRVQANTRTILRLLREFNTRATFFLLGCVAERHPDLVREIAADGHELATHGYAHEAVDRLDSVRFQSDVSRSLDEISSAEPNATIIGYRAPSFSINETTPWAHGILKSVGMAYDSSVSPASFHDAYGSPSSARFVHAACPGLLEIPVSTVRMLGANWQVAGGGYFRLMPLRLTAWAIGRINSEGQPAVVYLHPWEFDPGQPRVANASLRARFRHYVNLHKTEGRLRQLLQLFSFGPIAEVFRPNLTSIQASTE